eukprot:gnl/MRDRNA2_/MRDRNA2_153474_c0_seq1.p1 gnl/MRDRNA2_/MRDRNA2_153474_c0~~gnl/MRDRNA2_/MRDRNA2_153474_c0_seq1.p1  ORF type:complete len:342 (+),score=61.80 gnl/MRDRNA2_/MRDRNA2_153474_c0_seq1:101-1126(+)
MVVLGGTLEEKSGIGFGCMSASGQYSNGVPLDADTSFNLFKTVYDQGCRHFDTAEVYRSGGHKADRKATDDTVYNESQLGVFFASVPRESFTVATKFGPWQHDRKFDYETVKASLQASLQRLQLSYVDLYYAHRAFSKEDAVQFATSAKKLVEEGLVKNVGLSEVSGDWLRSANAVHPICCVQQEWSLLTRDLEESLVPACRELGVGIVAYSPLARSLLTMPKTRPEDKRRENIPRYSEANFQKNLEMLKQVADLASAKGATPSQLSLAWVVHKGEQLKVDCLPLPGTLNPAHAKDNIAGMKLSLSSADMDLLEGIAALAAGAREDEAYLAMSLEGAQSKL